MSIDTGVGRPDIIGHALCGKRNAMWGLFVSKHQDYVHAMDTRYDSILTPPQYSKPFLSRLLHRRRAPSQGTLHFLYR